MIKKCIVCKCDFIPKDSRVVTCSYECKGKIVNQRRFKNKPKKCKLCGNEFNPFGLLDKFCSSNCRIESQKNKRLKRWRSTNNIIGDKNPAYRNGNYVRGLKKRAVGESIFIKNGQELKQSMMDKKGFIYCEFCQTSWSPRFESHHLVYRSEKPLHKHLHDKKNILIVCIGCHNMLHKHKGLRNKIVELRKLNELFGNDVLDKRE